MSKSLGRPPPNRYWIPVISEARTLFVFALVEHTAQNLHLAISKEKLAPCLKENKKNRIWSGLSSKICGISLSILLSPKCVFVFFENESGQAVVLFQEGGFMDVLRPITFQVSWGTSLKNPDTLEPSSKKLPNINKYPAYDKEKCRLEAQVTWTLSTEIMLEYFSSFLDRLLRKAASWKVWGFGLSRQRNFMTTSKKIFFRSCLGKPTAHLLAVKATWDFSCGLPWTGETQN